MAFQSFASEQFWKLYSELPNEVQRLADKQYELLREDPFHPSLHLKQVGECASVDLTVPSATAKVTFSAGGGSARTKRITVFCEG
jgi:hypothetical protein